jgi:nitrosocyanin
MKWILAICFLMSTSFAATRNITIVNHEFKGTKQWLPGYFKVKEGDKVKIKLINNAPSGIHGFEIKEFNIKVAVKGGEKKTVEFVASKEGVFNFQCHLHKAHVGGQFEID